MICGTDFSFFVTWNLYFMKKRLKNEILPYGSPRVVEVRNLLKEKEVKSEKEKENATKPPAGEDGNPLKGKMPKERTGYIKSRKHDCL